MIMKCKSCKDGICEFDLKACNGIGDGMEGDCPNQDKLTLKYTDRWWPNFRGIYMKRSESQTDERDNYTFEDELF